eukprot:366096-Pelagomonas_calceolata.AAC.6
MLRGRRRARLLTVADADIAAEVEAAVLAAAGCRLCRGGTCVVQTAMHLWCVLQATPGAARCPSKTIALSKMGKALLSALRQKLCLGRQGLPSRTDQQGWAGASRQTAEQAAYSACGTQAPQEAQTAPGRHKRFGRHKEIRRHQELGDTKDAGGTEDAGGIRIR